MDILSEFGLLFSIFVFLDEKSRQNFLLLNRAVFQRLTTEESYHWRLQRLEEEYGVYYGQHDGVTRDYGKNLKDLFRMHYGLRHIWDASANANATPNSNGLLGEESFQTKISVRFKPKTDENSSSTAAPLPLSQRLALIRINYNLSSNQEALRMLGKLGAIGCAKSSNNDNALFISTSKENPEQSTVPTQSEVNFNRKMPTMTTGVHTIDSINHRVIVVDRATGLREYPFDVVLPTNVTQTKVYQQIGHPSVQAVLNGYNATLLMYGQTGSGKTHTMMGTKNILQERGILPRACQELFEAIQQRKNHPKRSIDCQLTVSYVEIFGNQVTDLLRQGEKVAYNMAAAHRTVLDGQASHPVQSFDEMMTLIERGEQQRKVAATAMNERSSRAHSLFFIHLKQTCGKVSKESRLILGDLGGAEQLKKSQGNSVQTDWKARTREAIHINQGLLALKNCVNALNQQASFVPYGASKLTMLLSAGLAPTDTPSRTHIVVCASQDPQHATETIGSLQFAQACSGIRLSTRQRNSSRSTDQLMRDVLEQLDNRIEACRERIRQEEQWETYQKERPDGYGGVEIYTVSKLSGAEHLNEELEQLLLRRRELTGVE